MNRLPFRKTLAWAVLLATGCLSGPAAADDERIDLSFQWIEVDLADWNDLVMGRRLPLRGPELEKAVQALVAADGATLLRQMSVKSRSGQRAKGEAIRETIFPEEYTPATLSPSGEAVIRPTLDRTVTRNIGVTVEFDPVLTQPGADFETPPGALLSPRIGEVVGLDATITRHLGDREWGRNEAAVKYPDIYSMQVTSSLSWRRGESRFVGSFEPTEASDPKRKNPRVLLFIRADFPLVAPPAPLKPGEVDFPVAEPKPEAETVAPPPTDQLGIRYEVLETELETLGSLLADGGLSTAGSELREALLGAKADVVDTIAAVGRMENRFKIASGLELLFPSEWSEPEISPNGKLTVAGSPVAFQMMELGTRVEVEVTRQEGAGQFLVNGTFQCLRNRGVRKFGREVSEVAFPLTHRAQLTQRTPMGDGELVFLGTLRPDRPVIEGRGRPVWAVFGQVDSLPGETP